MSIRPIFCESGTPAEAAASAYTPARPVSAVFQNRRELRRMRIGDGVRQGCLRGQELCRELGTVLQLTLSDHVIPQVRRLCWLRR